jgi:hypothetical protein
MRLVKLVFLAILTTAAGILIYDRLPATFRYAIDDWYARIGQPAFVISPDTFTALPQAEIIREYTNRGHKLKCYGNLQREERIRANNDYLCSAHINSAYDGIPAQLVTFFFTKGELTDVRLEFPSSSYQKLLSYLSRKLENSRRIDQLPQYDFGTDNMGGRLLVWAVPDGVVVTSDSEVEGDITVLLWSSRKVLQG